MAYRLKPGKVSGKAVRKIAHEQTARALASLSKDAVSPADVHEGRKAVKRLRSLLKLIEPALERQEFTKRYKSLGRTGKLLAGARDRHVLEQTIGQLEDEYGAEAKAALAPLKASLGSATSEPSHMDAATLDRARAAFLREARNLDKLKIKGKGLAVFGKGLEETYKTARRNFARAYAKPDDEHFHEFRKAVQWHWRHMALLSRAWPSYFAVRIAACQELADILGDDHDLCVLLVAASKLAGDGERHAQDVARFVRVRQGELRERAFAIAERLLAESPRAFSRRMEVYWGAKMPLEADAGLLDKNQNV